MSQAEVVAIPEEKHEEKTVAERIIGRFASYIEKEDTFKPLAGELIQAIQQKRPSKKEIGELFLKDEN